MNSSPRFAPLLALVVFVLACSSLPRVNLGGFSVGDIAQIAATPVAAAPETLSTPVPSTVSTAALVRQRSRIRVGIRYDAPPLTRINADGRLEGMDVDLARELARRWLGSEQNVEFVQVTSLSAPQKIANRQVDLALGGLIHTKQAELSADFSLTYLRDGEALLVRTGTYSDFVSMANRSVSYIDQPSTFAMRDAEVAANVTVTLQSQPSYRAAVDSLIAGTTEGVVGRWRRLRATASGDSSLAVMAIFTSEPVAIMLPQNDSAWAAFVDQTLSAIVADGTFARMYQKWFGVPPDNFMTIAQPQVQPLIALSGTLALRDTIATLRASNVIRVGVNPDAAPFVTLAVGGVLDGFEVGLVREMARRWLHDPSAAQLIALRPSEFADALAAGHIDMAIGGVQVRGGDVSAMGFSQTTFVSSDTSVALALPQDDSRFRDLVNFTLQEMQADGVYQKLFQRWFPDQTLNLIETWPGVGSSAALLVAPTAMPGITATSAVTPVEAVTATVVAGP